MSQRVVYFNGDFVPWTAEASRIQALLLASATQEGLETKIAENRLEKDFHAPTMPV